MFDLTLGDARLTSVEEISGHRYAPDFLLPQVTADIVARNAAWMAPDLFDPARNLLAMVRQSNVIRTRHHTILIDTCVGDCKQRAVPTFHMLNSPWRSNLAAAGVHPDQVDFVMCTHLHVDHVGWNTQLLDGRWVPTFPNARYIFGRTEFNRWMVAHAEGQDSPDGPVFADSVLPVVEAGQALVVDDGAELSNGFHLEPTPGHSPGHVAFHLNSSGAHVVFCGDVMHHPLQVRAPHLSSRFCEDPAASARTRAAFLARHADTDTIIAPAHFERGTLGRVRSASDGFHYDFLAGGSTRP